MVKASRHQGRRRRELWLILLLGFLSQHLGQQARHCHGHTSHLKRVPLRLSFSIASGNRFEWDPSNWVGWGSCRWQLRGKFTRTHQAGGLQKAALKGAATLAALVSAAAGSAPSNIQVPEPFWVLHALHQVIVQSGKRNVLGFCICPYIALEVVTTNTIVGFPFPAHACMHVL